MAWNIGMFAHALSEEGVTYDLPLDNTDYIKVSDALEIFPVTVEPAAYNPKIEQPAGPFWTYSDTSAVGTYTAAPKNIEQVRTELKAVAATERYTRESAGVQVDVQGQPVQVGTDRLSRVQFATNAMAGVKWKFDAATWIVLSDNDIADIKTAVADVVAAAFEWEHQINLQIDAAPDLAALDALQITTQPVF
jgi:hypothetical protein